MDMERMGKLLRSDLRLQILALPLLALLGAYLSNVLNGSARHLAWLGRPPVPMQSQEIPSSPKVEVQLTPAIVTAKAPDVPALPPTLPSVVSEKRTPNREQLLEEAQKRFPVSADQLAREIHSEDAWKAFQLEVPFLDARRSAEYVEGHVNGAWCLPVWESDFSEKLQRFDMAGHPMKAPVVIYCEGGDCQDSNLLASKLYVLGYRNLLIYKEGYPDWVAKKRPVKNGDKP
jgi:rhodanese-related sulfurtransferase